jgi:hypothetical protein
VHACYLAGTCKSDKRNPLRPKSLSRAVLKRRNW